MDVELYDPNKAYPYAYRPIYLKFGQRAIFIGDAAKDSEVLPLTKTMLDMLTKGEKLNMSIARQAVKSSNLRSVGYDFEKKTLEVEFNNGTVYQYFLVPDNYYTGLMKAQSKGAYLNRYIKDAYRVAKVADAPLSSSGTLGQDLTVQSLIQSEVSRQLTSSVVQDAIVKLLASNKLDLLLKVEKRGV